MTGYEAPTILDIYRLSIDVARKILEKGERHDCIVGVSRGGLIPTRLLSDFLGIKDVRIIRSIYYTAPGQTLEKPIIDLTPLGNIENMKILIVDDVADTGETLKERRQKILERGAAKVEIATLYVKPWRKVEIDYYSRETDKWIVFPWEIKEVLVELEKKGEDEKVIEMFRDREEFRLVLSLMGREA